MSNAVENEYKFTSFQKLSVSATIKSLETFLKDHGIPYN
jgi:hypothetical protein